MIRLVISFLIAAMAFDLMTSFVQADWDWYTGVWEWKTYERYGLIWSFFACWYFTAFLLWCMKKDR